MLYILNGPDRFSARERLGAIRRELDADGALADSVSRFDETAAIDEVIAAARTPGGFFSKHRLVVVEGLLSRFGETRRGRARGRRPGAGAEDEAARLVDALSGLPEDTTVVLIDDVPPGHPLLQDLAPHANVIAMAVKPAREVRSWAEARVRAQGASILPDALDRLVELVDARHLGVLAQDIDKLVTYCGGRPIGAGDVEALVSGARERRIFDLTDAVVAGQSERALRLSQQLSQGDQPPPLQVSMLVRHYRQLIQAQNLMAAGAAPPEIAARMGIGSAYVANKLQDQARRFTAARLEAAYRRLLEADVAFKTGRLDVETALELLIVELSEIARGAGSGVARRPPVSARG